MRTQFFLKLSHPHQDDEYKCSSQPLDSSLASAATDTALVKPNILAEKEQCHNHLKALRQIIQHVLNIWNPEIAQKAHSRCVYQLQKSSQIRQTRSSCGGCLTT